MKSTKTTHATGPAGELHQTTTDPDQSLKTNQGVTIADHQSSLKAGARGPALLEDFVLREKITHFDHERIPERVVHARGSGAHGVFVCSESCADVTSAAFLQQVGSETEAFVRISTVAGGAGSVDMPRDVRGFAIKLYTSEGNLDIVGNDIPVFFIQDAMKFPDLVHSVKMEPDRGFPQAASAHDTFWDFISLTPESLHMIMWVMSDRGIPRSLRMVEGFGVNTFRLVDAQGTSRFVKFHWRPTIGAESVVWDEALKLNAADPDFHRRDLWSAIDRGDFPSWELALQVIDDATAASLPFDVLDATKLVPEELVPLRVVGTLTLNRNPDNFFAETEQVAFCPANVVPGIDVSEDPLLQGRLFSYLDTQLSRLGGPNHHQIPINAPRCPMRNLQRDGHMQTRVHKSRVSYEPQSLDPSTPRENPTRGFQPARVGFEGEKTRLRPESFADHYSQARLFYRSLTPIEQKHVVAAIAFELGKVETMAVRTRMLGHLVHIDDTLSAGVQAALGMEGMADKITPAREPFDMAPSPALSMVTKFQPTFKGRKLGVLVSDGCDAALLARLHAAIVAEGGAVEVIAPKIGGAVAADGSIIQADHALAAGPSVLFDAVAVVTGDDGGMLAKHAAAVDFVRDAFGHLKVMGLAGAQKLAAKAHVEVDPGIVDLHGKDAVALFVEACKRGRVWDREPKVRPD